MAKAAGAGAQGAGTSWRMKWHDPPDARAVPHATTDTLTDGPRREPRLMSGEDEDWDEEGLDQDPKLNSAAG